MHHLLREWRDNFDLVVVDTPCVLLLTDACLLTRMADATIQVAERGVTTLTSLKRAYGRLSAPSTGKVYVVLSGVNENSNAYRNYYGYSKAAYNEKRRLA